MTVVPIIQRASFIHILERISKLSHKLWWEMQTRRRASPGGLGQLNVLFTHMSDKMFQLLSGTRPS